MLNPLSKESNVKASLKKYLVDLFGETVTFDVSLASPDLRVRGSSAIKQWYNVDFGEFGRNTLAEYLFDVYCLSRQDVEGVKLAEMTDTIIDAFVDSTKTDGMRRIPLYNIENNWAVLGAMVVQDIWDAPVITTTEDETKIKMLSMRLRWGAAI